MPPSQPGWVWYENKRLGVAVPYPETWRQAGATFHAPRTNSQIQMRVHDIPVAEEWLTWIGRNQESLIFTTSLSPEHIEANATVQGRPAYFRLSEGGGASQILLIFPDEERLISFYFHSGTLPRLETEMQIFGAMIDNIVLREGVTGETSLPTGWERGLTLAIYTDLVFPTESAPPIREDIRGVLEVVDSPVGRYEMVADDGQAYRLELSGYHFRGGPIGNVNRLPGAEHLEEGERVLISDYLETASGAIQPHYVAVERDGVWQLVLYKAFFDLTRETLDASLLARYPRDVPLHFWLRGPLSDIRPLLVDETEQSLPAELLLLDSSAQVLVNGTVTNPGDSFRLILEELFVFDGHCVSFSSGGEECFYWQQVELQ